MSILFDKIYLLLLIPRVINALLVVVSISISFNFNRTLLLSINFNSLQNYKYLARLFSFKFSLRSRVFQLVSKGPFSCRRRIGNVMLAPIFLITVDDVVNIKPPIISLSDKFFFFFLVPILTV